METATAAGGCADALAEAAEPTGEGALGLHACLLLRTLFYELLLRYGPAILALPPAGPPGELVLSAAAEVNQQLSEQVVLLLRHYVASQQHHIALATSPPEGL